MLFCIYPVKSLSEYSAEMHLFSNVDANDKRRSILSGTSEWMVEGEHLKTHGGLVLDFSPVGE